MSINYVGQGTLCRVTLRNAKIQRTDLQDNAFTFQLATGMSEEKYLQTIKEIFEAVCIQDGSPRCLSNLHDYLERTE